MSSGQEGREMILQPEGRPTGLAQHGRLPRSKADVTGARFRRLSWNSGIDRASGGPIPQCAEGPAPGHETQRH